jgi:stearoyl-CoA desaturase (delta-9 desaturase)
MHHGGSDTDRDPHSAAKGFWWAHFLWMCYSHSEFDNPKVIDRYTGDMNSNSYYRFLDKYFIHIQVAFGLMLLAIGGIPWVIWGVFVRLVLVYHSTWLVNSAAHYFGYKNFKLANDLSTNCWWVGLVAYGEGWHNNHHAFPQSARHGLRPWEIDITWMAISFLKTLGLATNIRVAVLEPESGDSDDDSDADSFFKGRMVKQAA